MLVLALSAWSGCVTVRNSDTVDLDGDEVTLLSALLDRGDVSYVGSSPREFTVTATTWGRAGNKETAAEREATVVWSAIVDDGVVLLDGISPERSSGVDFDVIGPTVLDVDVVTAEGRVDLAGVEGFHTLDAGTVSGDVVGDVVIAADFVDLALWPYEVTDALITSTGSVTLALPWGLPYDLTIRTSADQVVTVADLGFQEVALGAGFFNGFSGFGEVEIDVNAGGTVDIVELR